MQLRLWSCFGGTFALIVIALLVFATPSIPLNAAFANQARIPQATAQGQMLHWDTAAGSYLPDSVILDNGSALAMSEPVTITSPTATSIGLIVKQNASGTADIADFDSSTGATKAVVNYAGQLSMVGCFSSGQLYTLSGGIDDAGGPFELAATTLTATTATISTSANPTELCNPTANATYTLPSAATSGKIVTFTDTSTYTVTINAAASQTINTVGAIGGTTYTLSSQGNSVTFQSDGTTKWWVISKV